MIHKLVLTNEDVRDLIQNKGVNKHYKDCKILVSLGGGEVSKTLLDYLK